jgi:hypothetical protein
MNFGHRGSIKLLRSIWAKAKPLWEFGKLRDELFLFYIFFQKKKHFASQHDYDPAGFQAGESTAGDTHGHFFIHERIKLISLHVQTAA